MVKSLVLSFVLFLIKGYQLLLSPFFGKQCRFYPTCSSYAVEAFQLGGLRKGFILTIKRLMKCGPWHSGGVDLVRSSL